LNNLAMESLPNRIVVVSCIGGLIALCWELAGAAIYKE